LLEFKTIFSYGSELLIKNTGARWIKSRTTVMNKSVKNRDENFGIYLYILELQNGKYYVGITNNPNVRFNNHRNGETTYFVKQNLPIITIQKTLLKTTNRKEAEKIETKKALQLMKKHGIENVTGGFLAGDYHDKIIALKMLFNANID